MSYWRHQFRRSVAECVILFLGFASASTAQFWELPIGTNTYEWSDANSVNVVSQLWEAVTERCLVTGVETPTNISYVTIYWDTTNSIITRTNVVGVITNVYLVTNSYVQTKSIPVTNQFGSFSYLDAKTNSRLCYAPVTHEIMKDIDSKIFTLIPYFVCVDEEYFDTYNSWFSRWWNNHGIPNPVDDFPREDLTRLIYLLDLGYTVNVSTNAIGYITGGEAYLTKQFMRTNTWQMSQMSYNNYNTLYGYFDPSWSWIPRTGRWETVPGLGEAKTFGTDSDRIFADIKPEFRYTHRGTNPAPTLSIQLTGYVYSNNLPNTTNEFQMTYTVPVGTTVVNDVWWWVYSMSLMGSESTNSTNGDTIVFCYPSFEFFGELPYFLEKESVNARVAILKKMVYTTHSDWKWTNSETAGGYTEGSETTDTNTYTFTYGLGENDFIWWRDSQPPWDHLNWWTMFCSTPRQQCVSNWITYYTGIDESSYGPITTNVNPSYTAYIDITPWYFETVLFSSADYFDYVGSMILYDTIRNNEYSGELRHSAYWTVTNDQTRSKLYMKNIPTNCAHKTSWYAYELTNNFASGPIAWFADGTINTNPTELSPFYTIQPDTTGTVDGFWICTSNFDNFSALYTWYDALGWTTNAGTPNGYYGNFLEINNNTNWNLTFVGTNAHLISVDGKYAYTAGFAAMDIANAWYYDISLATDPDPGYHNNGGHIDTIESVLYANQDNTYTAQIITSNWVENVKANGINPVLKWNVQGGFKRY